MKVRGGISQKLDNFTSTNSSNSGSNTSSSNKTSSLGSFSSSASASPFVSAGFGEQFNDSKLDAQINQAPQPVFHSISGQHGNKHKSSSANGKAQKQQYITPEHNEMIKYVQQSWKGVERDYKKSVNNYINNIDINSSDHISSGGMKQKQQQVSAKKKTATTSTPLLLSGSYHHTSGSSKDSSTSNRQDAFRPFDLETFWGNRILKRLTEEI